MMNARRKGIDSGEPSADLILQSNLIEYSGDSLVERVVHSYVAALVPLYEQHREVEASAHCFRTDLKSVFNADCSTF